LSSITWKKWKEIYEDNGDNAERLLKDDVCDFMQCLPTISDPGIMMLSTNEKEWVIYIILPWVTAAMNLIKALTRKISSVFQVVNERKWMSGWEERNRRRGRGDND